MRLVLVEDDLKLGSLLERILVESGYEVVLLRSVAAVRDAIAESGLRTEGLAIVDWMLPDGDGLEVCRLLRGGRFDGPILMLTARSETADKVRALDHGVDDYLTKPFELDELLARLRALGRRGGRLSKLEAGPIHVDLTKRYAFVAGRLLDLTARELDLLAYLVRRAGTTVSKLELAEQVWEADGTVFNVIEVNVSRLRDKLAAHAGLLETVRGQGYRVRESLP